MIIKPNLRKKKAFMNQYERLQIIRSLKCIDTAIIAIDKDRTVRETLQIIKPHCFTNGGDQNNTTIPEIEVCNELGIELVDGLGDKIQSSSWLIKSANIIL